jgi:hypothetical protein
MQFPKSATSMRCYKKSTACSTNDSCTALKRILQRETQRRQTITQWSKYGISNLEIRVRKVELNDDGLPSSAHGCSSQKWSKYNSDFFLGKTTYLATTKTHCNAVNDTNTETIPGLPNKTEETLTKTTPWMHNKTRKPTSQGWIYYTRRSHLYWCRYDNKVRGANPARNYRELKQDN